MAVKAGANNIFVIHIFSRYGRKSDRVSVAGIALRLDGYMVLRPAARNIVVVAAKACSLHKIMIHNHWLERDRTVAAATLFTCGDMVWWFALSPEIVMAGNAIVANIIVIETHRLPAHIRMTIGTLVRRRDMIHGLTGNDDVVVAVLAAAKYFVVVHHGNRLKPDSAVAGVATLAGKDVLHGFRRGIKAAVDTVTRDAFSGGAGELAANVATLARHKVVTSSKLKTGRCVIEGLILRQHNAI